MTQLRISREGALGHIRLNRPEAINALSRDMIDGITATLLAWRDDPDISAVLFTGTGERGFCAGGDVRWVRQEVLAGRAGEGDAYFAAEYRMDRLIAEFPKPTVSLTHGVVMGGGIGVAGHCHHRWARPGARYAMPETAIGFVADVGVNALLARAPIGAALLFLLSGVTVGVEDAYALGLVDGVVEDEDGLLAALRSGVVPETVWSGGRGEWVERAARLEPAGDLRELVEQIVADPPSAELAAVLAKRSPTAMAANVVSHLSVREDPELGRCLELDRQLAVFMIRQPDFVEGVRAVLVDKDGAALWWPDRVAEVEVDALKQIVASVPPGIRFPMQQG